MDNNNNLIFEENLILFIDDHELDELLEKGWRHFGFNFFRYNASIYNGSMCNVMPLRIDLSTFTFSKKQRKLLRKNEVFRSCVGPAKITSEKIDLFEAHKQRFKDNIPSSIFEFVTRKPGNMPTEGKEVCVYAPDNKLIAASFMDETSQACSSIYGMFDLAYEKHSLGLYTMLLEIQYALSKNKAYYYHGYSYDVPSFYDYKKRFSGLQYYDWLEGWLPLPSNNEPEI